MSRYIHSLLNIIKRGVPSLIIFGVVLFPLYSTARMAYGLYDDNRDLRKVGDVSAFKPRAYDQTTALRPFKQPIVTIAFDDGWESIYTDALPLFQKYGIRTTQYVLSGPIDDQAYMSPGQIRAMENGGHEIGCHSVSHADLTTLGPAELDKELTGCQDFYSRLLGHPIRNFASPYSSQNEQTLAAIGKLYDSHRNTFGDITNGMTDADVNFAANYDKQNLISFAIRDTTTVEEIQKAIEYTIATNGWLILTYHQLEEDQQFGVNAKMLDQQLAFISRAPVRIASISDVINTMHGDKGEY